MCTTVGIIYFKIKSILFKYCGEFLINFAWIFKLMFNIFWRKSFKILEEFDDEKIKEFICQVYATRWFLKVTSMRSGKNYLIVLNATGWWPRSYRKYILQITQPSQYRYATLQYRFAVTSGSPSMFK